MQALFWDGQHLRLETAYPTPPADETTAVVRVRLAGICATDLQILRVPGRTACASACTPSARG